MFIDDVAEETDTRFNVLLRTSDMLVQCLVALPYPASERSQIGWWIRRTESAQLPVETGGNNRDCHYGNGGCGG